jgi:hypothetical protein
LIPTLCCAMPPIQTIKERDMSSIIFISKFWRFFSRLYLFRGQLLEKQDRQKVKTHATLVILGCFKTLC